MVEILPETWFALSDAAMSSFCQNGANLDRPSEATPTTNSVSYAVLKEGGVTMNLRPYIHKYPLSCSTTDYKLKILKNTGIHLDISNNIGTRLTYTSGS